MKNQFLTTLGALAFTFLSFGQAPQAFKYQAVIRDASNLILNNQSIGIQLTIQQGSAGGTAVYTETFAPTTNAYGLVNLQIGTGTTVDNFAGIDWSNGPYFMETAVDLTGGTSYTVMGTSELVSVPYALHAAVSDSSIIDQVNDADADSTNELQTLSIVNDTLYLSDGGSVSLSSYNQTIVSADPGNSITAGSDGGAFLTAGAGADSDWEVIGNNMRAMPIGGISIGQNGNTYQHLLTIGDTGVFRVAIGHSGAFNEIESGRLVFTEDVDFNGTCGFEWHHDGAANTLSLESGCTTLSDTSIVFTRTGEVRIPERVKVGENTNPSTDIHIKQSSEGTTPAAAGIRFESLTTSDQYQLWTGGGTFNFGFNGTRVSFINNAGAYTQISDRRLKSNIVPIGSVLDRLLLLEPVQYNYSHLTDGSISKGFIAQDVQKLFPEMVNVAEDTKMLALSYDEFSVITVKAIQEQQEIIDEQQRQIDELKAQVEMLMQVVKVDNTPQEKSEDPEAEKVSPIDADQK